jgi:hypothetical protein
VKGQPASLNASLAASSLAAWAVSHVLEQEKSNAPQARARAL